MDMRLNNREVCALDQRRNTFNVCAKIPFDGRNANVKHDAFESDEVRATVRRHLDRGILHAWQIATSDSLRILTLLIFARTGFTFFRTIEKREAIAASSESSLPKSITNRSWAVSWSSPEDLSPPMIGKISSGLRICFEIALIQRIGRSHYPGDHRK